LIGQWKPENKFVNLFEVMDTLWEEVEELDENPDSKQQPDHHRQGSFSSNIRSGRQLDSIGKRGKELTMELAKLTKKLAEMPEIDYDKNKIKFVHMFTERALESNEHIQMIVNRLKVIEKIHEDSPDINATIDKISAQSKANMPQTLAKEEAAITGVKKQIGENLRELQKLMEK